MIVGDIPKHRPTTGGKILSAKINMPSLRRWGVLLALGLVAAFFAACYPGGPEEQGDLGLVLTLKDPDGNFSALQTYAMEDVVHPLIDPNDSTSEPLNPVFNQAILEEIQSQLAAAGFTRELDYETTPPTVWVDVGAVQSETWFTYYSWGYWGWGWYPGYVGSSSFTKGSVIWQMLDVRGIDLEDPEATGPAIWLGGINGVMEGDQSALESAIRAGIRQGFAQSPYIRAASPSR
jgi:hypothetical protein